MSCSRIKANKRKFSRITIVKNPAQVSPKCQNFSLDNDSVTFRWYWTSCQAYFWQRDNVDERRLSVLFSSSCSNPLSMVNKILRSPIFTNTPKNLAAYPRITLKTSCQYPWNQCAILSIVKLFSHSQSSVQNLKFVAMKCLWIKKYTKAMKLFLYTQWPSQIFRTKWQNLSN